MAERVSQWVLRDRVTVVLEGYSIPGDELLGQIGNLVQLRDGESGEDEREDGEGQSHD